MSTQSEQVLENQLVDQLQTLGYEKVQLSDEAGLLANLKRQLEKHNGLTFSEGEYAKILNHLSKGNIFERAKRLRDRFHLSREDGSSAYVSFLNTEHWCRNEYQVTQQVSIDGVYKNRYDVTLLVNGLPLVQIELKRRGKDLKEAFGQIDRYKKHSYWTGSGLFQYVQLFVISNGAESKYFSNQRFGVDLMYNQTFYWTDAKNNRINRLPEFAEAFLEKCHLSKMISKYIVLKERGKVLMVLRPYQYHAVEAIVERVKHGRGNGYIWHTTGSGKTLTSFKASQNLIKLPHIKKVLFVVDRSDLDDQTQKEFNAFAAGSVDGTSNTAALVKQMKDDTKLIVTTIQKLNIAIQKTRYRKQLEPLRDERWVFIFDECHRSQFGDTHQRIDDFFTNKQLFGFTGTPIFADNASSNERGKRTTKDLFEKRLHEYLITNAIKDENVLRFSIEYVGRYQHKEGREKDLDIQVEGIDTQELLNAPKRTDKIVDYIIANHDYKTHNREFSAIFCVGSVEMLIKYYDRFQLLKEQGKHDLRIATIFSFNPNQEQEDKTGLIGEVNLEIGKDTAIKPLHRDKLEAYMADYQQMYGISYSTKEQDGFYNYYRNLSKRLKEREYESALAKDRLDILLVVNMFLTGFDAKKVNTLYVDKNLRHHGLIQAFSRTNRILNLKKSYGNVVSFRNLKASTDEAITLFSNQNNAEEILLDPYHVYVERFNAALVEMIKIAPTVDSVDKLMSEEDELAFIKSFRQLIRFQNVLKSFSDFDPDDLDIDPAELDEYKSKYLGIRDKVKRQNQKEKVSILQEVDFELELIHRDEINVAYILKLLAQLRGSKKGEQAKLRKEIVNMISGEVQLQSKRELIEKFIEENLPKIEDVDDIPEEFAVFWDQEKQAALDRIGEEENLHPEKLSAVIQDYLYSNRKPLRNQLIDMRKEKPKIREWSSIVERLMDKIMGFVELFEEGLGM